MTEEIKEPEYEPERIYTSTSFQLDWNMLLYNVKEEDGFQLDWNKLIYNEEQLAEFHLQQKERFVRPEFLDYLIKPASERSAMEKHFLTLSGFACDDDDTDAEYDNIAK